MDTHTFKIGDLVKATSTWSGLGVVDNFNDWWVIVQMEDGVKRPFMEGELQHVVHQNV